MPEAARQGDPIGHSSAMSGLLMGIAAGVVLAAAVVAVVGTGGVAAVAIGAGIAAAGASGGLAGEYIGEAIQTPTGAITTGSPNTVHEGKPAARAKLDFAMCSQHGPSRIAEGSSTVDINGEPAARKGDHLECGAVIMSGAKSIIIGGETKQVLPVHSEVPAWLHNSLIAVAIGGTIIATGGAAAVFGIGPAIGGLVGSLSGGWALGWVGGEIGQAIGEDFGNPELGKRIGEVSFGVIGSFAGGFVGARYGAKFGATPANVIPEEGPLGARGASSGRTFDPEAAGGPIVPKTTEGVEINHSGIDAVEQHISRFPDDQFNDAMVSRLRAIADGKLEPTQQDLNFYTHELDEYQRYQNLGWKTGVPDDQDAAGELWNNTHTAALEDYGLKDIQVDPVTGAKSSTLYHPSADPRLLPPDWTPPPGWPF